MLVLHVVSHTLEVVAQVNGEVGGFEKPIRRKDDGEIRRPDGLEKRERDENRERAERERRGEHFE